ncbi:transketolase [Elusimicrobiota bacterium]
MTDNDYHKLGRAVRREIIEILAASGRGHIASAFSLVEMLLVLYREVLRVDPRRPDWEDRDRLILSKGHGCLALYPILADMGFFPREELREFCAPHGILGGHPEHNKIPGVEASTGALGHGLSIGVGMALAARMDAKAHRVFVILGDGECNEGSIWEAALSASKHRLGNLVALVDHNKQQSYGDVAEVLPLEPFADKWRAFGFEVREADMDRPRELLDILTAPRPEDRPLAIICHTVKGKGVSFIERNLKWHHKSRPSQKEISDALAELKD